MSKVESKVFLRLYDFTTLRLYDFTMLKIIDKYILKRYLGTFIVMLLMFIPIGIVIDVSEKVNKMIENDVAFSAVAKYYLDFTIYFANLLFPIFLFLSVIWFTSKLANNTEIIAILSSGISFSRFLRPYIIGATIVSLFALVMTIFWCPMLVQVLKTLGILILPILVRKACVTIPMSFDKLAKTNIFL